MFQDVTPSREKKPYRSHFFTRRCSYVFYLFTRISSTTLKFTRELYRKDGKQIQIRYRYRYSRFDVTPYGNVTGMFSLCLNAEMMFIPCSYIKTVKVRLLRLIMVFINLKLSLLKKSPALLTQLKA